MTPSPNEDRARGAGDKAKGRIKEAAGDLSGDRELQGKGQGDQAKGTMKEKKGLLRKLFK
jgi:uncharacterized protein YjbJ (UPF0337 family)